MENEEQKNETELRLNGEQVKALRQPGPSRTCSTGTRRRECDCNAPARRYTGHMAPTAWPSVVIQPQWVRGPRCRWQFLVVVKCSSLKRLDHWCGDSLALAQLWRRQIRLRPRLLGLVCLACDGPVSLKHSRGQIRKFCNLCTASRFRDVYAKYGLKASDVNKMLDECDRACQICRKKFGETWSTRFMIDHDHTTNAVRGLLCNLCNTGMAALDGAPDPDIWIQNAKAYLESSRDRRNDAKMP